jgi:CheY-like chemotaxis protein
MGSLRLNLCGYLDTVLLRSDARRFWCPRIAAAKRFPVLTAADVQRLPRRTVSHGALFRQLTTPSGSPHRHPALITVRTRRLRCYCLGMKRASKKDNSHHLKKTGRTTATKGRVLEVGDEEPIREFIAAICKNHGFDVIQARCGDEALSLYRKCGPFVIVLTDLYWYDGGAFEPPLSNKKAIRHGIQLALAIRKLAPEQNIVIHTAASQVREQMPKELSDIRVLEKPFCLEELESLL